MRIALNRRVSITDFDGVNKFIALMAEGFAKLGHEPVIISLCHDDTKEKELTRWFKETYGLDLEIPIYTLKHGCGDSWLSIAWNWWWKGSKLLRKAGEENRALKMRGYLILTILNIASLFRRLKLLLSKQPIYRHHVREYTMEEVLELIKGAEFDVVESYYSRINDLTYIDADQEDYLRVKSYKDLIRITVKRPTKANILRTLAYPLVKLKPSLRQLIIVVATKVEEPKVEVIVRW